MRKVLSRAGQSTLEYVIVLTAIVAAILFAATQFIKPGVNKIYGDTGNRMNASSDFFIGKLGGPQSNTTTGGTTGGTSGGTTGGVGV
jgi:type II secretory pathway component PulF